MKTRITVVLLWTLISLSTAGAGDSAGGKAMEVVSAGGYTYLRLADPDVWIATSPADIAVGDEVEYSGGMEMRDFHSNALDRTFESILFVQEVRVAGRDTEGQQDAAAQQGALVPAGVAAAATAGAPAAGEITALDGGTTVAALLADPASLEGQEIRLRARVTKVSANIMDRNWITLQDGSGANPEDKLMATSTQFVNVGDVVIASGTLRSDVDIGSGYRYEALLEDARFE
ncbi:MAG: DNA-binding protein [Gammaproteobacteria bacterium]|jgi:hypothetical protein|nr:DNA-binding protein [Gammaproteobacteria bacterium]